MTWGNFSSQQRDPRLQIGASKLEDLRSLSGQIRQHFYKVTLPWPDEDLRLLPIHFFFELKARMRELEREFNDGIESFLTVYPEYLRLDVQFERLVRTARHFTATAFHHKMIYLNAWNEWTEDDVLLPG